MALLTIITMLALLEFIAFGLLVGLARGKYDVPAPATTGDERFERAFRVHYNTLEMLVLFIPGLWAFGYYINEYWAAGAGVIYLLARVLYAVSYIRDPGTRGPGLTLSALPVFVLIVGGLIGAAINFF